MSALTLLSVPASPVAGPSKGSSGAAESGSGFGALLAVETSADSSLPDATQGTVANSGEDEATAGAGADDALTDSSDTPGLQTASEFVQAVPLLTPPSLPERTLDGDPSGAVERVGTLTPDLRNTVSDPPQGTEALQGKAQTVTAPTASPSDTKIPTPASGDQTPKTPEGGAAANMAGSAVLTQAEQAGSAVLTQAEQAGSRTGATPVTAVPMPAPPPLRPLAERTSRPLDAPAPGTGDPARDGESASGKTASPGPAPATAPSAAAREPIAVAPPAPPTSDGPPTEFAPSADGAAAEADAPTVVRETALSQLSRVTVEATAQIAAQILRRLEGRSTRFEIALTPAELGRVDVKLDIDSEGRLQARLAFDNPAAATDLRGRADELRRQLEDAGFHLGEDALEFAERDSGSSAFDRGQDARSGQSRAFTAAARLNAEIDVAQPPGWMALTLSPSGVDMKV